MTLRNQSSCQPRFLLSCSVVRLSAASAISRFDSLDICVSGGREHGSCGTRFDCSDVGSYSVATSMEVFTASMVVNASKL